MSIKRYSNVAGVSHLGETFDPVTGKPKGDFVDARDYDALQAALREALSNWAAWTNWPTDEERSAEAKHIAELRAQFLDDK